MAASKIGIIGNGNVGSALERDLKRTGREVKAVERDKAAVRDTAAWADTVIVAVPFGAVDDVVRTAGDALEGKTVVDVTNALDSGERGPGTGLKEAPRAQKDYHQWVEGHLGRYETTRTADDYKQAGERYRSFEDWERDDLVANIGGDLRQCPELEPLPGKPAPHQSRTGCTYASGKREEAAPARAQAAAGG